jgi:acyl-coenzyme A synthetase/AMP-(fatty) acid ligase
MSVAGEPMTLRERLQRSPSLAGRQLWGASASAGLADVAFGTALGGALDSLSDAAVLLRVRDPLFAAIALIELDGVARRIVLCPPDLADEALPDIVRRARIDAVVSEAPEAGVDARHAPIGLPIRPLETAPAAGRATEWVMFTSGTSGPPKMVAHTFAGLTGAIKPQTGAQPIWATFYDIRRYGGLQILLRALLGEGSLALTAPQEPLAAFLGRLGRHGATHITGTPSHWRRVLMSPESRALAPLYVRLSGEIADQGVLDALKARFPGVPVGHAYASTEAGVGFEVNDGLEGFPAAFVGRAGEVELRVVEGSLRLRSRRTASGYVGQDAGALLDDEGFVDSGDMVELRDDRYHFVGRRDGVINVGGLKAHPEEIEAVINRHPAVRMSRVRGRRNPITGAIVVADVVLNETAEDEATIEREILADCRASLAAHKMPTALRFVPALSMTAGGKLERSGGL